MTDGSPSRADRPKDRWGGSRPGRRPGRDFQRPADDPPGTSRLFIAVPLPYAVRDAVGELMARVAGGPVDQRTAGGLRWVRVEGLHLTLRFLGATPDERQPGLAAAIRESAAAARPFSVVLAGAGAFPSPERPRALWLGIRDGATELAELAAGVDRRLADLGWAPDERPFRAHLTLARADGVPGGREAVERLVAAAAGLRLEWHADRLVLYKSLLGRGPARYESVAEAPLGPA